MNSKLEAYKPAAPARIHLLSAAVLWTAVGVGLLIAGLRWASAGHLPAQWLLIALALVAGLLKARFILRKTARRIIDRINARGDGRCLGGFLSLGTWLFVIFMMSLGWILRHSTVPRAIVGLLYTAVGAALLTASITIWSAWRRYSLDPDI